MIENTNHCASWTHLAMASYAANYYSYTWSRVFAADMYLTKFKENPFCIDAGAQYRKHIISQGGTEEPIILLTRFLGRAPNNEAFLQAIGIKREK